jgi:predicted RNase H-like HicB family nuclease
MKIHIKVQWDEEADVWVAESEDLPGLITEADTTEGIIERLHTLVPELLEANACRPAAGQSVEVKASFHKVQYTTVLVPA